MKKLLIILCVFITFSSCSVLKETKKNSTTKETESSTLVKDSISNKETSLPINDRVVINVPKTDNAELMEMFRLFAQQFNTSKTSGSNSYTSRYDEEKNQVVIDFVVAATEKLQTISNKETSSEKTIEQQTDEYIEKKIKRIPWWVWALAAFWFLPSILQRVQLVLNPLASLLKRFRG